MVELSTHVIHIIVSYFAYFEVVNLARFKPEQTQIFLNLYQSSNSDSNNTNRYYSNLDDSLKDDGTTSTIRYDSNTNTTQIIQFTTTQSTSTTIDPNSDLEELVIQNSTPSNGHPETANLPTPTSNKEQNQGLVNKSKPSTNPQTSYKTQTNVELSVLFFSIFVVYVSFVKLIYHNVGLIKYYMTEPG